MTAYLLDTNIVSELVRPRPSERVLAWMDAQQRTDLFIASMTIAEMQDGIHRMPPSRRRNALETWFAGPSGPGILFAGRVLAFDEAAGLIWGRLMAEERKQGRARDAIDMIIAATAERYGCVIATANESEFAGIDIVNPLRS